MENRVQSCPKTKIDGIWLSSQITESMETLSHYGFVVRAVVSQPLHQCQCIFRAENRIPICLSVIHSLKKKIYVFYESVHLLKNMK